MTFDLARTTPLSEYVDMLYVRLAVEMPKHEHITDWWVSLHPPRWATAYFQHEERDGTVGYVELHAMSKNKRITYRADMKAAQHGARVSTEVLETVVEHHVAKFVEGMTP